MSDLEGSAGYKKLAAAVANDHKKSSGFHDYDAKFQWVLDRVAHYAEKTGVAALDLLNAWEEDRSYWYMNYYQDCNQPLITSERIRVFDTVEELLESIGKAGFRCPLCKSRSKSPYTCDSGEEMSLGKVCDWKVYGLLDIGSATVFVKEKLKIEKLFTPIAWEADEAKEPEPA